MSNNSAVLLRNRDNLQDFKKLMKAVREFGEPGFFFVDSLEHLTNPCYEIGLCPVLIKLSDEVVQEYTLDLLDFDKREHWEAKGYTFQSGFQFCNLTEQNASVWKTRSDALLSTYYGTILGTLQAAYTDMGYLGDVTREITEREALLGVSMTGMMDSPELAFDESLLCEMASLAVETNRIWAEKLGINQASRVTTVKPAGNSTVILSEDYYPASGIHPHKAKDRMLRRVQVSKDDPVAEYFTKHNPHLVEESVWSANKTDNVITFPIEIKPGALSLEDFTAIEFLEKVKLVQNSWVKYGTARPMSCENLTHNVSNTCVVNFDEWGDVGRFIYSNRNMFSGISLLSSSGDFMYRQAPMQRVIFEDELSDMFGAANVGAAKHLIRHIERRYGSLYDVMMPLKMVLQGYSTDDAVRGTKIHSELLWDTYKRIRAVIHIEDTDNILMLLSSIDHEELWNTLVSEMADVDYALLREDVDNTKAADTIACGGGACEVDFTIPKD